jgi:hypothetical protein
MTPEKLKQQIAKAEQLLAEATVAYHDCILALARLRAMADILYTQTGNREFIQK